MFVQDCVEWLRELANRVSRRRHSRGRLRKLPVHTWRPALEYLEDRIVPNSYTVTNTSSSATTVGSLPYAVVQANKDASGSPFTINFASGPGQTFATPQTIALTATLNPNNGESIIIAGPAAALTIQGGGSSSNFTVIAVGATATLNNLIITNGNTTGQGGGVYTNRGSVTLNNCTVSNNAAKISSGGGLYCYYGTAIINNCTFNGNSADLGGGIYDEGSTVEVSNSTFFGNSAPNGGALYNLATMQLNNCTVSGNSGQQGGGIYSSGFGVAVTLISTIVAGNTVTGSDADFSGAATSISAYNLIGDGTGMSGISNGDSNHNQVGVTGSNTSTINPSLGSLLNNGGPTATMALQTGSPAFGAGQQNGLTADQRGYPRPATNPDIGAYQTGILVQQIATTTAVASSANPSASGQPVIFTATVTPASGTFDNGGTVQFAVDGSNFGAPAALGAGKATISDSALSAGAHTITAIYSGDTNFSGSTSAALAQSVTQTVNPNAILTVYGTAGNDNFSYVAGSYRYTLNGVVTPFAHTYTTVQFHGNGGNDTATLTGSPGADSATLSPNSAQLSGPGYEVDVGGVTNITVYGGGGSDQANFADAVGTTATFLGRPTYSDMYGNGFYNRAVGFPSVRAVASNSKDIAYLYDSGSQGGTTFVGRPTYSDMYNNSFFDRVVSFQTVWATACIGGDIAYLYDFGDTATFVGRPTYSDMYGTAFFNRAVSFSTVVAENTNPGDIAYLYDLGVAANFVGRSAYSDMSGNGFLNRAVGFQTVWAYATNSSDSAYLYDSPGNNTFVGTPTYSRFYGGGFFEGAVGFRDVYAYAASSSDVANLYRAASTDSYIRTPSFGYLAGANFLYQVWSFGNVYAQ